MRRDKAAIGGEDVEFKVNSGKLALEVYSFLIISAVFIYLLLTHSVILRRYFDGSKFLALAGAILLLIISPFGAHLVSSLLSLIVEKLRKE